MGFDFYATDMSAMFATARQFNQNIGSWDVSAVGNMPAMFAEAVSFNQNLSQWNLNSVTNMSAMFNKAEQFNQNIAEWDVSSVSNMFAMFEGVGLSTENYDALLSGWSSHSLQNDVIFDAGNSVYTDRSSREILLDTFGWVISDGGVID